MSDDVKRERADDDLVPVKIDASLRAICCIPWWVAKRAYREYAKRYGTTQSLDRLYERGGFYVGELNDLYGKGWENHAQPMGADRIAELEAENKHRREGVAYYIQQARMHRTMCIGYMKASDNLFALHNELKAERDRLRAELNRVAPFLAIHGVEGYTIEESGDWNRPMGVTFDRGESAVTVATKEEDGKGLIGVVFDSAFAEAITIEGKDV